MTRMSPRAFALCFAGISFSCKANDAPSKPTDSESNAVDSVAETTTASAAPGNDVPEVARSEAVQAPGDEAERDGLPLSELEQRNVARAREVFQWLAAWGEAQTKGTPAHYRSLFAPERYSEAETTPTGVERRSFAQVEAQRPSQISSEDHVSVDSPQILDWSRPGEPDRVKVFFIEDHVHRWHAGVAGDLERIDGSYRLIRLERQARIDGGPSGYEARRPPPRQISGLVSELLWVVDTCEHCGKLGSFLLLEGEHTTDVVHLHALYYWHRWFRFSDGRLVWEYSEGEDNFERALRRTGSKLQFSARSAWKGPDAPYEQLFGVELTATQPAIPVNCVVLPELRKRPCADDHLLLEDTSAAAPADDGRQRGK